MSFVLRRSAHGVCAIFVFALGCSGGESDPVTGAEAPAVRPAVDGSVSAASRTGRYRISARPARPPAPLGALHDWIVRVERTDGAPVTPVVLSFDGGMPSHGHGFVTAPRVTRSLGGGEYLVEGVKFHMAGDWEIRIAVTGPEGRDEVSLPISVTPPAPRAAVEWTEPELALLESLSIASLRPPPPQPSNRVADDRAAAELGQRLFFDPSLSVNGRVSCATCHEPERLFTDGRATSRGVADTSRNAPTLAGAAHSPWMFWDGRRDSLWAQALGPLETAAEMGGTRLAVVRRVAADPSTAAPYVRVFGSLPDLDDQARFPEHAGPFGSAEEREHWGRMSLADRRAVDAAFANIGKAIGAYERLLMPGPARFDRYVESLRSGRAGAENAILTEEEIRGLRLFVDAGRTLCLRCHNGPLLTNQSFHDIGTAKREGGPPDFGRFLGLQAVLIDPFNCLGAFSDARPEQCGELRFLDKAHAGAAMGKFKTPTLRGLPRTAPFMHDGRFTSLDDVIEHYRSPPAPNRGATLEITPLALDAEESRALVAFLTTLDGDLATPERWLRPPLEPEPEPELAAGP